MSCIYCVVDMHAYTDYADPAQMGRATREMAAAYIAAGVDPKRDDLFNQSQVPEHAQLAWIFNCVARLGWLDRMTQFKEKGGKNKERSSVGLYTYPVLQAADILVYKATHVPVGEDQRQHLELARDIAQKFNNDFAAPDFFPLLEPVITGVATRVMSLRDGTKKMSKSDESDYSRINMTDDADTIAQKIRKARTDPAPLPNSAQGLANRAEATNLVNIYAALNDTTRDSVIAQYCRPAVLGLQERTRRIDGRQAHAHRKRNAPPSRRSGRDRPYPQGRRGSGSRDRPSDLRGGQADRGVCRIGLTAPACRPARPAGCRS